MNVPSKSGIQAQTLSVASSNRRQARPSPSTLSVRPTLEIERYMAVVCSLALMVLLVAGMAGYASIRGLLASSSTAANATSVENHNREAGPERVVTPTAIVLALVAVL